MVPKDHNQTNSIEALTRVSVEAEVVEVPIGAKMAKEGAEVIEHLIVPYVAKMRGISQRIANTTKWPEN